MNDLNVNQDLEREARVVQERMPIEPAEIAAKLKKFMFEYDVTQSRVAKYLGVSSSVISQFVKGVYKGNLDEISNKAVNLINTWARRDKRVEQPGYVLTTVAKRIAAIVSRVESFSSKEDEGKIAIVVGEGGHGKSACLRQYAVANKNTVYVELDKAMTTTNMFAEIAHKLGLDSDGSLSQVTRRLIDNLQNRQMVIMLDEAAHLSVSQLDLLRQVIVIKCRCPLILAGNQHLLKTVMKDSTKNGYESLDQFTSRLMAVLDLDTAADDKDGGLYTIEDIRKLYEYGGMTLSDGAAATLQKIARAPKSGRLRTCSHIIAALHLSTKVEQWGKIDSGLIVAAIHQLDLPIKIRLPIYAEPPKKEAAQAAQVKAG